MGEVADRYRRTRERVTDLVLVLEPVDLERPVPACPGWTVHEVVAHAVERVPGLRIEVDGAAYGPDDAVTVLRGDRYGLYRSFLGRRSAAQIRSLDWQDGPPERIEELPVFGPAPVDVIE